MALNREELIVVAPWCVLDSFLRSADSFTAKNILYVQITKITTIRFTFTRLFFPG